MDALLDYATRTLWFLTYSLGALILCGIAKALYNISPLHPLAKYPGPVLWRASRVFASLHHARGDLYQHIATIHEIYGETVRIAPDELSFTSPGAWTEIYNKNRPQLQKSQFHFASGEDRRLPESMITATDAEHMRLRRLAGPAFLNSSIREVESVLQRYVDQLCYQLKDVAAEGSQNMVEWLLWTLNDVIGHLALATEFQCLEKRRMHPWPRFLLETLKTVAALNQFKRFGMSLKLLAPLMTKEMMDAREAFFQNAQSAVRERLSREESGTDSYKRPDIIGLMLRDMKNSDRLSEDEITSNSILIVGGGAETTSTCISATLYHLCKTPRVMQKLKDEVRRSFANSEEITLKALEQLDYLKATVDESLRLFSVASYITPRLTPKGGYVINGEVIPGNTYVSMGQWYMGRSERFFDKPLELRPERCLNEEKGPAGLSPDEVMRPFSLGPRNCIGKLLALAEAKLVVAKLLWHFDIELDGPHNTWVDDARFYILWQLKPLMIKFTPVSRE